jgi:hypothetical protein
VPALEAALEVIFVERHRYPPLMILLKRQE